MPTGTCHETPGHRSFTQEDPIGLAGGLNLYGFANGDPVNFSDPFGDSTFVGCRPLRGTGKVVGNHCAVAVGENGTYNWGELLNNDDDNTNRVDSLENTSALPDGYKWTAVSVPGGKTQDQFDAAVVKSYYFQRRLYIGQPYDIHSLTNSNYFVFAVISGAGGTVPSSARRWWGFTPGLCGGSSHGLLWGYLSRGNRCSR